MRQPFGENDCEQRVRGACARCARVVPLHLGTTRIAPMGRVDVFCAPCWPRRDEPLTVRAVAVDPPLQQPTQGRLASRVIVGCAIVGGIAAAVGTGSAGARSPVAAPLTSAAESRTRPPGTPSRHEALAPLSGTADNRPVGGDPGDLEGPIGLDRPAAVTLEIPWRADEPIDEWYPTLAAWAHPVTDSRELVPKSSSRHFGAGRDGVDRPDCGAGHCGVDLDGVRGTPVVAVAWGVVARIQPSATGRGGKYVRLEHPDGIFTSYMHLDDIAPELALGDEVEAGTVLGTLGRTGIHHSTPHLHFSLEIPAEGEAEAWTYIDPAAFLVRARVMPRAEVTGVVPPPRGHDAEDQSTAPTNPPM